MFKKLIVLIFISFMYLHGQGSTSTPYDTTGWSIPQAYTTHYSLPVYRLLSNPGGWINLSQVKTDSLLYALVVFTDTCQMAIISDTLRLSPYISGQHYFAGTAQYDTIKLSTDTVHIYMDSLDVVVASVRETIPTVNDILSVKVLNNKFVVQRPASGTTNLKYNWIWIRKYQ